MLELGQGFNNTYEQSKYEAELLVHRYIGKGLPISIIRPSMVMGDSTTGRTTNFRLFYEPLHFFALNIFSTFPLRKNCFQNIIHIDTVTAAMCLLMESSTCGTFHLVSPNNMPILNICEIASEFFRFRSPVFIENEKVNYSKWSTVQKMLAKPFLPYFNNCSEFLSIQTQELLARDRLIIPRIDEKSIKVIFKYCAEVGYIKKRRFNN
jgi:long-chain acyl-CoA synthetase